MDNLSTHWTNDIRSWAADSNVELIPTPTYASFLNRIECHFWAISEFVINCRVDPRLFRAEPSQFLGPSDPN